MDGMLTVNRQAWVIRLRGEALTLPYQEFLLLAFFVENPGKVFTRKELITRALESRKGLNERSIDLYVARVRQKLGDEGERLIVTVRNVGYRLDPPPEATSTFQRAAADSVSVSG